MVGRGELFDRVAETYDTARPGYPAALYDDLVSLVGLAPGSRVLEIGCGTGQATRDLGARGASVLAIEPGPRLAERARRNLAGVDAEVVTGRFEDVELEAGSFDLVVSATAFHWVDSAAALPRIADGLTESGSLALWWTVFFDPDRPDRFAEAARPLFDRWLPGEASSGIPTGAGHALDRSARIADIDRSGRFGPVTVRRYSWGGRHTAAELRALFSTHSPVLSLPDPDRAAFLDQIEALATERFGRTVERPYTTELYAAPRRS